MQKRLKRLSYILNIKNGRIYMKVVFLDCDGVINNRESFIQQKNVSMIVDPLCIQRLNTIVKTTGARFVISSTWRCLMPLEELITFLKGKGFIGEIIDRTPQLPSEVRGVEIEKWMDEHNDHLDVRKFVILDDNDDMGKLGKYLCQTTFQFGLTDSIMMDVIRKLNGE